MRNISKFATTLALATFTESTQFPRLPTSITDITTNIGQMTAAVPESHIFRGYFLTMTE